MKRLFSLVCLGFLVLSLSVVAYGWKYEKELAKYLKANPQTTPEIVTALTEIKFLKGMNWREAQMVCSGLMGVRLEEDFPLPTKHISVDENGVETIKGTIIHRGGGHLEQKNTNVFVNGRLTNVTSSSSTWVPESTDKVWLILYFDKGLLLKWEIDGQW